MTLDCLLDRLETLGIERPMAMPVSKIIGYDAIYNERHTNGHLSGFEPDFFDEDKIKAYLEPWQTIIGLTVPYLLKPNQTHAEPRVISQVSIMAWEWDYHQVIKDSLRSVLTDMSDYCIHVDSGPLPERSIALKMGIAKAGRSQMLIHPRYGTGFYLAFVLTNLKVTGEDLPEVAPSVENSTLDLAACCTNCNRCQKSCPSNALTGHANFDGGRCISALTQRKGLLSDWEMSCIGTQLYGCDICQRVCPANADLCWHLDYHGRLPISRQMANKLEPSGLLTISQKGFMKAYGTAGFAWRGVKTMKRNALINMGNSGDANWINEIEDYLKQLDHQNDEILKITGEWALSRLKAVKDHTERM